MFDKYVSMCKWCSKTFLSIYKDEVICHECDCLLIDMEHPIYTTPESQELILNGYSPRDIQKLIEKDMTYIDAYVTLRKECDKLVDSF